MGNEVIKSKKINLLIIKLFIMRDIFISHVEEDANLSIQIAERLEEKGISTWYYEQDSLPGISYMLQTGQAIENCQALIILISIDSLSSNQVTVELERAHETKKHIIPIRIGISHNEMQNRQPLWRQIIGTRTSIQFELNNFNSLINGILRSLNELGIGRKQNDQKLDANPTQSNEYCDLYFGFFDGKKSAYMSPPSTSSKWPLKILVSALISTDFLKAVFRIDLPNGSDIKILHYEGKHFLSTRLSLSETCVKSGDTLVIVYETYDLDAESLCTVIELFNK